MCFIWFTNCYSAAVCDRYSLSLLRAIHKSNTVIPFRMYVQSSVFVCNNMDFSLVSFAFCPFGRSVKEFHVSVTITLVIRLLWGNANLSQGWMNVSVTGHQPMMKLASAFVLHTFKVGLWFVNKHRRRRRRKKKHCRCFFSFFRCLLTSSRPQMCIDCRTGTLSDILSVSAMRSRYLSVSAGREAYRASLISLHGAVLITPTQEVLFPPVLLVCWSVFISRITQKTLDYHPWSLDGGWASAQNQFRHINFCCRSRLTVGSRIVFFGEQYIIKDLEGSGLWMSED